MELTTSDFNTELLVGDAIIATFALESRISRFYSRFDSSEKGFQGQVYPNLDILKNLRIDQLKFWSFGFPGYKDAVGFVQGDRFVTILPGNFSQTKCIVIDLPTKLKGLIQNRPLRLSRIEPIAIRFTHGMP